MHRPRATHAPMRPTAGSAVSKSPSQARATPPRPIASSTWLTMPFDAYSQLHMMPAATSGMIWGRKSTVRDTMASRLVAKPRMVLAVKRPSSTGMKLK